MCIDFHISNCKSKFFKIQVAFDVYFSLWAFGENRFLQKEIDFFLWLTKTYVDFHFLTYDISISLTFLTKK